MIRRLVTSLTLVVGAFAFQAATATQAHATDEFPSCVTANDDTFTTPSNTPIDFTDTQILDNDVVLPACEGYSHDDLFVDEFTPLTAPSHGTLVHVGSTFTYTPDNGFSGTDQFNYEACLQNNSEAKSESVTPELCDTATVFIDPQVVATTTTATVLATTITAPTTTTVTVLAAQLAVTGVDTSATLPLGGLLTGTGALFVGGAAMARRRLKVRKYKKA